MKGSILDIIPKSFRGRSIWVALTILIRALLNFVGLAMLVPVLVLILDTDSIHQSSHLSRIYEWLGFSSDEWFVVAVCVAVVGVILVKCAVNLWLYTAERNFIYDLYNFLSRRLYIDYHNRGLGFIKSSNSSLLARNVNVVCLTFVVGILRPLASIASEIMLFMMLFIALICYNAPAAALILLIFAPAAWLYIRMVRNRLNNYGDVENKAQRTKMRNVIDTYRGYSDIEVCNAFPAMLERFDKAMHEVVSVRLKNATLSTLPQMFTEIGLAFGLAIMVLLNLGLESGNIKILFGIFAVAALRLMPSVRNIMSAWASLRYNRFAIDIISDAHIDDIDISIDDSTERMVFEHEIQIDNISFQFADGEQEVINSLSLSVRKGERVGIRGRSGAGKTTLFNLMLGFLRPTGGAIYIDGKPLYPENRRQWLNIVGYVSQNIFLTDGTLLENIALGIAPEDIDHERLERAIEMADLREFIDSLPQGVDTPVGECGNRLSGGQRQRIGIARALYKEAEVLFFDEATSSLDNNTEQNINKAIEQLSKHNKELTIIVIAHRESSLDYCERILTLESNE
ncbi:MAG: ABC transporter ATP-binding protein [Alistipes sp.]|nr:ABC transporter ATP-binding protein [Alistipes sp.]